MRPIGFACTGTDTASTTVIGGVPLEPATEIPRACGHWNRYDFARAAAPRSPGCNSGEDIHACLIS
jgi:hypothetical protein